MLIYCTFLSSKLTMDVHWLRGHPSLDPGNRSLGHLDSLPLRSAISNIDLRTVDFFPRMWWLLYKCLGLCSSSGHPSCHQLHAYDFLISQTNNQSCAWGGLRGNVIVVKKGSKSYEGRIEVIASRPFWIWCFVEPTETCLFQMPFSSALPAMSLAATPSWLSSISLP